MGLRLPSPRIRVAIALLALLAVAAGIDGARLWHQHQWNEVIAAGAPLPAEGAGPDAPPELRFAQAHAQAAEGADEAALRGYRGLETLDSPLGRAARYNGANLLMRQAAALQAGPEPGKSIALIELAKENYRDLLRADPQDWNARYNLERAQRLLPDPDEAELAPPENKRDAERAATTMRGYAPGLP